MAGEPVRLTVPALPELAWFGALGIGLWVLAGAPVRVAWPPRLGPWLVLGAVLGALAALSFFASVVMSGFADGTNGLLGGLTAVLCAYGPARLALALLG